MSEKFNKIIDGIKSISLSTEEKKRLWHNVDAYVLNNPVVEAPVIRRVNHGKLSPFFFHTQRIAVFSLVAVMVLGGSTSIAAQTALPNDALYSIKVNVNEEVRSWFSFGAESKAYYETKRAGERLDEAQKLAVMGKLDTQAKEKIQTNLKKHVENVQKQIATIEANNDLKVAIDVSENFENSLKEHTKSLTKIEQEQKTENKVAVAQTKEKVEPATEETPVTPSTETSVMSVEVAPTDSVVEDVELAKTEAVDTASVEPVEIADPVEPVEQSEISQIVNTVQENINVSAQIRQEVESKIPLLADDETKKVVAEDKRQDAVNQIEKVKTVLDQNRNVSARNLVKVSATSATLASTTLDKAIGFVAEGDKTFAVQEYGSAFTLFKNGFDTAVTAEDILSTTTKQIRTVTSPIKAISN